MSNNLIKNEYNSGVNKIYTLESRTSGDPQKWLAIKSALESKSSGKALKILYKAGLY